MLNYSRFRRLWLPLSLAVGSLLYTIAHADPDSAVPPAAPSSPMAPAILLIDAEHDTEAEDFLKSYIATHPNSPDLLNAQYLLATTYRRNGQYHYALDQAEAMLAEFKDATVITPVVPTSVVLATSADTGAVTHREILLLEQQLKSEIALEQELADKATIASDNIHKLLAQGDLDVYRQNDALAVSDYTSAYNASLNSIDVTDEDRLRLDQKYAWALLQQPLEKCAPLLETFARRILSDSTATPQRLRFGLMIYQKVLHRDLTPPKGDLRTYVSSLLNMISGSVAPWDIETQGRFVTSMVGDHQNRLWVGTEDNGVWCDDAANGKGWTHFSVQDGLGDDDAYALACDKLGRIWVGHLNHGVSVFNGKEWKNYDVLNGPIGSRVFAIAASPLNGDVWIATEAGLTRYSLLHDSWQYYTTADGLPSNQATSLAIDKRGTLYVGTDCDGIAIASDKDSYKTWRRVIGPKSLPNAAAGEGIPTSLINTLFVDNTGGIWAGTTCGLAHSTDGGLHWRFRRGQDWPDKIVRAQQKPSAISDPATDLLEDYITCLTQDDEGNLYIGFRRYGYEILNLKSGECLYPSTGESNPQFFMSTLVPLRKGYVLLGQYGEGLRQELPLWKSPLNDTDSHSSKFAANATVVDFPSPAPTPELGSLTAMAQRIKSLNNPLNPGEGQYLGADWATEGDWVGRYGKQYAVLCAAGAPFDHEIQIIYPFSVKAQIGLKHDPKDGLRRWVEKLKTDNPHSLYDPLIGYRRQAEWDDHGEVYYWKGGSPGPDIWITIGVPNGIHRVSLYFINKDGHGMTASRYRDYVIELKPYTDFLKDAESMPTLARVRVHDFWGGMYQQFIVAGPGKFYLKITKNESPNTIVSGVFIDQLSGPKSPYDYGFLGYMGDISYAPPDADVPDPHLLEKLLVGTAPGHTNSETTKQRIDENLIAASKQLWSTLDPSQFSRSTVPLQWPYCLLAYRAAVACGASEELLGNWHWNLHLWDQSDRDEFQHKMNDGRQDFLRNNPDLKGLNL
jgi:hypothetical protein